MSESKEQALVNAQVSVNRAVFSMNAKMNPGHYSDQVQTGDEYILGCIEEALDELANARKGYDRQASLDLTAETPAEVEDPVVKKVMSIIESSYWDDHGEAYMVGCIAGIISGEGATK